MNEKLKNSFKLLNYYNQYSTYLSSINQSFERELVFENIRFIGIENKDCLRFELNNGCQIIRRVDDSDISYEALTDIEYKQDEIDKIVFKKINSSHEVLTINNDSNNV